MKIFTNMQYYYKRLIVILSPLYVLRRRNFIKCGKNVIIGDHVKIVGRKNISIGNEVIIDSNAILYCNKINELNPQLIISDNVHISRLCSIGCSNRIFLGEHVRLAPCVHITDRNHCYEDIETPIWLQKSVSPGPVIIGPHTWLGYGSQVMPGVQIGKHCIIAAGSIVTKNIPDYSVVGGNPAKIIKQYNVKTKKWERI